MTAKLDKTIKRELDIDGKIYTIAIAPDGVKVTEKGRRNGPEMSWRSIISGDASLTAELNRVGRRDGRLTESSRAAATPFVAAHDARRRASIRAKLRLRRRQTLAALRELLSSDAESAETAPARGDSRATRARASATPREPRAAGASPFACAAAPSRPSRRGASAACSISSR